MKKDTKEIGKDEEDKRILGRRVAKELSTEELHTVTGGTTSCSGGAADDCDSRV